MTIHTLGLALAYVGAALSVAMVLPQLVRSIRQPDLGGVAPTAWGLTVLASLAWLVFGLRTATWPQVPGNVLLICGAAAVALVVPSPWSRARRAAALAGASAVVVALSMGLAPVTVGYLGFAIGLVSSLPQLVDSYGNWRSRSESGISLPSWSVRLVATACWLAYALIAGDRPVLVASAVALLTILVVFALETSARQASARYERRLDDRVLEPA